MNNSRRNSLEKSSIQPIVAGVVGAVLLVGSVVFYALKIDVTVALVVGIVGLVCVSFALYNTINPNTKLEKVGDIEQLDLQNLKASLKDHKCQVIF